MARPPSAAAPAVLPPSALLEQLAVALRAGRSLHARSLTQGVTITVGLISAQASGAARYAIAMGHAGALTVVASARGAAARFLSLVGDAAALAALQDPQPEAIASR